MDTIRQNLEWVLERIAHAAERSGRNQEAVQLMAVTKTQPRAVVEKAYAAGIRLFGENRLLEAQEKYAHFQNDVELHLIGHLQRNKAKIAAGLVSCVQSIDKMETAVVLDRYCAVLEKKMDILLEVNTSGEESKQGFRSFSDLERFLDGTQKLPWLRLRGLMTIAPFSSDTDKVRQSFRMLKHYFDTLRIGFSPHEFTILSMGMSSDFEIAIEEGSNLVRIGTSLFGERDKV
ncbi:MAG: YggS family pyridoxal phosphate-dependent enzyme [Spirochaetota bacterium]